ncbi:hypothetical protein FSP39_003542 [Pinctada imbricata]|uniref:Heat shock 70 kDa protein 12B n=1 Tax=Pinctada imbricata TaxID=66713 RepID=A0AA88Y7I0_PINIB|nr:hypothetical protein FSP39_003542 [Pinctada imbricata]
MLVSRRGGQSERKGEEGVGGGGEGREGGKGRKGREEGGKCRRGRMPKKPTKYDKLLVAAIDFGTTYSGYAFSFKHEFENDPLKVSANTWTAGSRSLVSLKTPTTVLFEPCGKFFSFGYEAEDKYSELAEEDEHEGWYYFRRFKMTLFDKKTFQRRLKLKDINNKEMEALKVFSSAIGYLKKHLMKTLNNRATGVQDSDIHWVLTVPAIWNDSAKQFMREAAEQAGIDHEQLSIALEPEAASLYCMHIPVEKASGDQDHAFGAFSAGSKYLVLDCGGGTVDITVHEVQKDKTLKELDKASGGAWGGTMVDESYKQMLIKIVGSEVMTEFQTKATSDFVDMFREFETKKRTIKHDTNTKITIKIPISLVEKFQEIYDEDIKDVIDQTKFAGKLSWVGDKCRMTADIMKNLFIMTAEYILEHVKDLMQHKECKGLDKIVMVGGFSESPILQHLIRSTFEEQGMRIIIPPESGLAVLKGAVIFGHSPKTVKTRIAKFTYGLASSLPFDPNVHPESKKRMFGKEARCMDIFSKHVTKGSSMNIEEFQSEESYSVVTADQTAMTLKVYTSPEENPKFVTDEGCELLGRIEVDMSDLTGGKDRKVICKMSFAGTELEVEAEEVNTKKITRVKLNFLL